MAINDADELVVAGNGQAWFAPTSATLPDLGDDPTAGLDAAFIPAGYITEDGATLTVSSEVTDFMAWQSRTAVRREKQTQDIQFSFTLQQWNSENISFAFGGGTVQDEGGGIWSYQFPGPEDALDERALVVDAQDGDNNFRFVFPRGNVTEAVETQFTKTATAQLPITFKALQPSTGSLAYVNTDLVGFEANYS